MSDDPKSQFLFYQAPDGRTRLEVRLQGETVWLTQAQMAELFQRERSVITKHIRNLFDEGELAENSVCANYAQTAADGKTYQTVYYNLDVIISVGYRVKSHRGTQFRIWAAHGQTAAEVVHARANATKPNLGLTSWLGTKPTKEEAAIAKNYLAADELDALNRIVTAYLEFAELQALNRQPMYMRDWIAKLEDFLRLSDRDILTHVGTVSHEEAVRKAELEFEKFRHQQLALPSPVEKNFEAAVKKLPKPRPKKKG